MKSKKNNMLFTIILILVLVFSFMGTGYAADTQVVLDFDELSGVAFLPDGYAGLSWQPGWVYSSYYGANYQPHSFPTVIHFVGQSYATGPSAWVDFSSLGTDVIFDGAWFGGHGGTGDLWFEGWRDGVHVATSNHININNSNQYTSTYLAANFGQLVDRVHVFATSEGLVDEFCMDNFTYTIPGDISVDIEIMPNDTNTVNLKSKGLLPIAIYGSADFDVEEIDATSVSIGDVFVAQKNNNLLFAYEDINYDGFIDVVCKFDKIELVLAGELDPDTTSLTITGCLLNGGENFIGTDDIIIVPIE